MKILLIFAAALLGVQAVRVPYIIPDSSEEEYHILLPTTSAQGQLNLSGLGLVNKPILQAVKVKVPRYADPWLKQQLIQQFLAPHGLTLQGTGGQKASVQGLGSQGLGVQGVGAQSVGAQSGNAQNVGAQNGGTQGVTVQGLDTQGQAVSTHTQGIGAQVQYTQGGPVKVQHVQRPSTQVLPTPSVNGQSLGIASLHGQNSVIQDLLIRTLLLQNPTNQGWGYLNIDLPNAIIQTAEQTQNTLFNIELRNRRQAEGEKPETGTIVSPLQTTTVPDIEPEKSDITSTNKRETDVQLAPVSSNTQDPAKTRLKRSTAFNNKNNKEITKVTPVPPVPQGLDTHARKISDISRLRLHRAVTVGPFKPTVVGGSVDVKLESTTVKNCDIECTKLQYDPVCAFNGECYYEFANQCVMDTFVCKRPDLGFKVTRRGDCQRHFLNRCSDGQLKSV